jgi:hypothetical protein
MPGAPMKLQAAADQPAGTMGWPRSPVRLFGVAAAFFVVVGTIFILTGILNTRSPVLEHGQITRIPAGYLWFAVAVPFLTFALIYWAVEFEGARVFGESPTRIHFVCTFFAVVEVIRVYMSGAASTGNMSPEVITSKSFSGCIAFLILAVATFIWNVSTSRRKSVATR